VRKERLVNLFTEETFFALGAETDSDIRCCPLIIIIVCGIIRSQTIVQAAMYNIAMARPIFRALVFRDLGRSLEDVTVSTHDVPNILAPVR